MSLHQIFVVPSETMTHTKYCPRRKSWCGARCRYLKELHLLFIESQTVKKLVRVRGPFSRGAQQWIGGTSNVSRSSYIFWKPFPTETPPYVEWPHSRDFTCRGGGDGNTPSLALICIGKSSIASAMWRGRHAPLCKRRRTPSH